MHYDSQAWVDYFQSYSPFCRPPSGEPAIWQDIPCGERTLFNSARKAKYIGAQTERAYQAAGSPRSHRNVCHSAIRPACLDSDSECRFWWQRSARSVNCPKLHGAGCPYPKRQRHSESQHIESTSRALVAKAPRALQERPLPSRSDED